MEIVFTDGYKYHSMQILQKSYLYSVHSLSPARELFINKTCKIMDIFYKRLKTPVQTREKGREL